MSDFTAARRQMVDTQVRPSDVTRLSLIDAMLAVPRERFVTRAQRPLAYAETQLPISPGRAMLEPRSFAKLMDALAPRGDDLMLYVGAGAGYGPVVAARLASAVVALEQDADLAARLREAASELEAHNLIVEEGPLADGAPTSAPFDVIFVEGGVTKAPQTLLDQLKDGGRLVCILQNGAHGQARLHVRAGETASSAWLFDCSAPVLPGFDVAPAFEF